MNNKGLSSVVVVSLFVLGALLFVGAIWAVVYNSIIEDVQYAPDEISCLDQQLYPLVDIKSACFNEESQELELRLIRDSDSYLDQLKVVVKGSGESESFCCGGFDCPSCGILNPGEERTYYLGSDLGSLESLSLTLDSCVVKEDFTIRNC